MQICRTNENLTGSARPIVTVIVHHMLRHLVVLETLGALRERGELERAQRDCTLPYYWKRSPSKKQKLWHCTRAALATCLGPWRWVDIESCKKPWLSSPVTYNHKLCFEDSAWRYNFCPPRKSRWTVHYLASVSLEGKHELTTVH